MKKMKNKDKSSENNFNAISHKTDVRLNFNALLEVLLFIILFPLLIMLDIMGMDVFSDD